MLVKWWLNGGYTVLYGVLAFEGVFGRGESCLASLRSGQQWIVAEMIIGNVNPGLVKHRYNFNKETEAFGDTPISQPGV